LKTQFKRLSCDFKGQSMILPNAQTFNCVFKNHFLKSLFLNRTF
jgi:hypothetical protein